MNPFHVCRVPATGYIASRPPSQWLCNVFVAVALLSAATTAQADRLEPWAGPAPGTFTLSSLDRSAISLADARDSVVIVHFFATWCEPCRAELASLEALRSKVSPAALRILAIDVGEPETRVRRYFSNLPVNYAVLLDPDRATAKAWGVSMFPTTFVLRPGLVPALKAEGDLNWNSPEILHQLALPPPPTVNSKP